jgi:hypothetical protein
LEEEKYVSNNIQKILKKSVKRKAVFFGFRSA